MQNIYQESVYAVERGKKFCVNLQDRSLKIDGKYVIKQGKYEGNLGIEPTDEPLKEILHLFKLYQHSVPSERSENKRKVYFRALPENELNDKDMLFGERRDTAQVKLELYVLCSVLNGSLKWDNFAAGLWFWQSPENKDLVILKDWIEPKTNDK